MIKLLKKYKYVLTGIIVLLLIIVSVLIRRELSLSNKEVEVKEEEIEELEKEEEQILEEEVSETVFVDVKGAIVTPGVYEVESDKRVIDAINKAGGLLEDANTSLINLAKKVEDAMVIIVYTNQEIEEAKKKETIQYVIEDSCVCPNISNDACLSSNNSYEEEKSDNDKVIVTDRININTASILDLETLPGIGSSKAQAIIDYRDTNGLFKSIEEIKNVTGIGESVYEKIKDYITV